MKLFPKMWSCMKKYVLTMAALSVLCLSNRVFGDDKACLFEHARTYHRCYRDGKDIGYLCPFCSGKFLLVPGKLKLNDGACVAVKMDCKLYVRNCLGCTMFQWWNNIGGIELKVREELTGITDSELYKERESELIQRYRELNEKENVGSNILKRELSFVRESQHMEYIHSCCFVCFKDFKELSDQERKDHLWNQHSVCRECDYEEVKDKEEHLENKHGCNCSQPWSSDGHLEGCSSRWLWCDDMGGLCEIAHFREKHRCNEKCEIRYDSKSGKNVIFHGCHIKCPECLENVPAVHMDKTEHCSKKCRSVYGKWEHAQGCEHWVACTLCTDKVVCATPLHMQEVHACELKVCRKKGKVWEHGKDCPAMWCSECESTPEFGNKEFLSHMRSHGCSCKIVNPSRGHEKGCPCRKQCPASDECVFFGSIKEHMKATHKNYGFCPKCHVWGSRLDYHIRYKHECACKDPDGPHSKGCPCFLECPVCKKSVSWGHMSEEHHCKEKCGICPSCYVTKQGEEFVLRLLSRCEWKCDKGCENKFSVRKRQCVEGCHETVKTEVDEKTKTITRKIIWVHDDSCPVKPFDY